jgi:hypothetical protein
MIYTLQVFVNFAGKLAGEREILRPAVRYLNDGRIKRWPVAAI